MSLSPMFYAAEIHQPEHGIGAILLLHSDTGTQRFSLRAAEAKLLRVLSEIFLEHVALASPDPGFASRAAICRRLQRQFAWRVDTQTISAHLERLRERLGPAKAGVLETRGGRGIRVLLAIRIVQYGEGGPGGA